MMITYENTAADRLLLALASKLGISIDDLERALSATLHEQQAERVVITVTPFEVEARARVVEPTPAPVWVVEPRPRRGR